MRTLIYHLIYFTCTVLISCSNSVERTNISDTIDIAVDTSSTNTLEILDTTIILAGLEESNYHGLNLTVSLAKEVLYSHFSNKGYYNSDNLPDIVSLTETDSDKLSIDFDTIFITELNANKNKDAVITYWLTPLYASGNCWQPHKAIIIDTKKGYKIINEEFIPDNYAIDSVVNSRNDITIYGSDYDCGNHKTLRHFRIKLK